MGVRRKNRLLATFLAIIGGSIGIHKFYLGQSGLGVLFILLTIFIVPKIGFPITAILGFIDAFRLLTKDDRTFDRQYNSKHVRKTYGPPKPRRRQNHENRRRKVTPRKTITKRAVNRRKFQRNPFKKSGMIKFKDFRYQEALIDFKKGIEISPHDKSLHFNLACTYSLLEKKEEAFKHLSAAVTNGFKDTNQIHVHEALSYIRVQREFDSFVKNGYQINSNKEKVKHVDDDLILENLKKLKELREKGAISEIEYQRAAERLRN